jgi:hypothetical protein
LQKKIFLLLASSKDIEPQEPITIQDWNAALMASQALKDGIFKETNRVSSFSERASSNSLRPVDVEIARLRKQANPKAPPRPVTPSSDAVPNPSSVPSTLYWDIANARSLFQPRPEESVQGCLQRRIDLINEDENDWSRLQKMVEGADFAKADLSDKQLQRLFHKCFFLRRAYEIALLQMGKGKTWKGVCEETIEELNKIGIKTYTCFGSIQEMNRDFRRLELFPNPRRSSKAVKDVELFALFPEAHNMLLSWAKKNLETLNSETARQYLLEMVIPVCLE